MAKKKSGRKRDWPDSEMLVHKCYEIHADEIEFRHFALESIENAEGKDFLVRHVEWNLSFHLQVKSSDNTETKGFILPPLGDLPKGKNISERMLVLIANHLRKHPDIPHLLFVGKPVHSKRREDVLCEIWHETLKLFVETETIRNNSP